MPNSSFTCAGASNNGFCRDVLATAMLIVSATSRYWGRFDDNCPRRAHREQCGQVDHQRYGTTVAPLMNRLWGLDECITRADHYGFSRTDHVRLSSRILAPVPL